jgi:hypothetical protein
MMGREVMSASKKFQVGKINLACYRKVEQKPAWRSEGLGRSSEI